MIRNRVELHVLASIVVVCSFSTAVLAEDSEPLAPSAGGRMPLSGIAGKKLLRAGDETYQAARGHRGIVASEVSSRVGKWQDSGYDGVITTVATHQFGEDRHSLISTIKGNMLGRWYTPVRWEYKNIEPDVKAFRAARWGRLRDNFLWTAWVPTVENDPRLRLTDDAGWRIVAHNVGVLARVVRESGFKGIFIDAEQYRSPMETFNYYHYMRMARSRGEKVLAFQEAQAVVRRRGRQWAKALTDVFPGITVIWYPDPYGLYWRGAARRGMTLKDNVSNGGLMPAFMDGVLVDLDERATITAGASSTYMMCEYRDMMAERGISEQATSILSGVPDVARRRLGYAFGLWTDAPVTGIANWSYTDVRVNHRSPEVHKHACHNAMVASDRYAWTWGEPSGLLTGGPGGPTPLIREYWKAQRDAHREQDLYWRPPVAADTTDYRLADAAAARADEEYWKAREKEGYRVVMDLPEYWRFTLDPQMFFKFGVGPGGGIQKTEFDDSSFYPISIRRCWQSQGFRARGPAHYRVFFDVPADMGLGRGRVVLAFGARGTATLGHVHVNGWYVEAVKGKCWWPAEATMVDVTNIVKPGEKSFVYVTFLRAIGRDKGHSGLAGHVRLLTKAKGAK